MSVILTNFPTQLSLATFEFRDRHTQETYKETNNNHTHTQDTRKRPTYTHTTDAHHRDQKIRTNWNFQTKSRALIDIVHSEETYIQWYTHDVFSFGFMLVSWKRLCICVPLCSYPKSRVLFDIIHSVWCLYLYTYLLTCIYIYMCVYKRVYIYIYIYIYV